MRLACVALRLAAALAVVPVIACTTAASAQTAQRPNLGAARAAFYGLSNGDRLGLYLLLIGTGDYNAMVSDNFGNRIYDSIVKFQVSQSLDPTGIPDPVTMAQLRAKGGRILSSWGMHFVDHPSVQASLYVPGAPFGLVSTPTQHGLAFENGSHTLSVDFSFFPADEAGMADIFARLSTPLPTRRIDMRVIRDGFFAVAGGGDNYGTYSRYIPIAGGTVGFTVTWNTATYINGIRVAVLMANGLLGTRSQPSAPPPVAAAPPPAPLPPPQQASLEPPPTAAPKVEPPKPVTVTGSGFFVSAEGDLLTNNHVIKGCANATITGRGTAHLVAKDAKNDLALLRLDAKPAEPLKPAMFRTTPLQLGEAVYVLGFPYAGALDNGVNFTNGLVSSVAGMDNDTTEFQMTAAVQPGNSGGPVLDSAGNLLGVTVARMNDIAALVATSSVPQSVNFGIKGDVAASFMRVNGVEPKTSADAAPLLTPQIAAGGKAFTAQVMCVRSESQKNAE